MIIAIDGPAGSGKSTVAKLLAAKLGFAYLDTGAMYRAVTWRALDTNTNLQSDEELVALAQREPVTFGYTAGEHLPSRVFIADEEVTAQIRLPQTDAWVSCVSAVPGVRQALVAQQRRIGSQQNTVMEGRDIGTTVFPDAELKVFLTARPEIRAARRLDQNVLRLGEEQQLSSEDILAELMRRDQLDSEREASPLMAADDALTLDTSAMTTEQVVDWIASRATERATKSAADGAVKEAGEVAAVGAAEEAGGVAAAEAAEIRQPQ